MSCTPKSIAKISELDKICQLLNSSDFHNDQTKLPADCLVAISPLADTLVLSRFQIICVLTSEWCADNNEDYKFKFHLSWSRNICHNDKETITSVLVLPVAAVKHSSRKGDTSTPDWTCVAVGFSSGYIRFYNDNGDLLLSHLLHDEPLSRLKCQSFISARHVAQPEQQEELYTFHTTVLCVLPGFPLFSTLKAARNQLARVNMDGDLASGQNIDTPLTFHKWRFTDQLKISDCIVVGSAPSNTYHHLLTASLCGGFETHYKASPPQCTQVIATGSKPFIGFHFAMESSNQLILTDVAKVVANKLKSALGQAVPSWFLGGSKQSGPHENATPPVEPAEDIGCRFGLCDSSRQGIDIILSPLRSTCVVTDFLGRVILLDTYSGVSVRIWKGYRDAQCGWIPVEEETSKNSKSLKRIALFLVIYAPKRNLIEIFPMQQGPKIASFTISEPGRLLYTSHGLMGVSIPSKHKGNLPVLFLSNKGDITEISIPFHCVLTENNSTKARNLHLLKKLRSSLREYINNESKLIEEIIDISNQLTSPIIIKESLNYIKNYSCLSSNLLNCFLSNVKIQDGDEELKAIIICLKKLTEFYEYIISMYNLPPQYTCVVSNSGVDNIQELSKKLFVSEKEIKRMSNIISSSVTSSNDIKKPRNVTFSSSFKDYIQTFVTNPVETSKETTITLSNTTSATTTTPVETKPTLSNEIKAEINKNISSEILIGVSNLIFQSVVYGNCCLNEFIDHCMHCAILEEELILLAIIYWSNKQHGENIYQEMIHFSNVLKSICIMKGDCNESWWKLIRHQLSQCTNPLSAMTGAIICRGVAAHYKKIDQIDQDDIDWETYEQNSCQWSLLIGQLEDISILDKILTNRIIVNENYAISNEKINITLEYILKQGRGCVSQLVARWCCTCGLNPEFVVDTNDAEFNYGNNITMKQKNRITGVAEGVKPQIEESNEAKAMSPNETILSEKIKCLKKHFPYSLSCSSLLANMCLEYQTAFEKHPQKLEYFEATLNCLERIQSSHIKQGVSYLFWTSYLRIKFESCLRLLHKVGKVPKELFCKQDLNLSESQIANFLQLFIRFFECFIQACMTAEASERPKIKYELFWEGQTRLAPTFVQQCLTQPPVNYELLHLLLQATHAFHIMVFFDLRVSKPLNCFFDSAAQVAIFTDIHTKSILLRTTPSTKLTETRSKFLLKALSAAVEMLDIEGEESDRLDFHKRWIGRLTTLAGEWGVTGDVLRIHQVCELYLQGHDKLAQEVVPLVSDTTQLGSRLLLIIGMRLNQILLHSKNTQLKDSLSCISPTLFSWLNTVKSPEHINIDNINIESIQELSNIVSNLLPEDHIAELLAQCLPQLVNAIPER